MNLMTEVVYFTDSFFEKSVYSRGRSFQAHTIAAEAYNKT